MRLVLLRHGETDRNAADLFQAQADIPLNPTGTRQAREVARALSPGAWAAVWSSPLVRADRTAAYAAERLGVPHHRADGLRERDLGTLDGRERAAYAREHPEEMRRLLTDPDYAPPGGETGRAALSRFAATLRAVAAESRPPDPAGRPDPARPARRPDPYPTRPVLVVTHGGVLNLLTRALDGGPDAPPGVLVGTCAAACVDIAWTPDGRALAALRRRNVPPHACEALDDAVLPPPSLALDDLVTTTPKEATRT
ncbi:histidine phosphatase family protein [Streptomyces sp. NPDC058955]|uniref:histidine phosphatase family protein n=1 Tax=unclassified Streptomyces TaxID=2593676 RepID=UPI003654B876